MGKRFYITLIFFLLSIPVFLVAQNYIVHSELVDKTYVFDSQTTLNNKYSISNYFLHELALGNTSTSLGFSYGFNYLVDKKILKRNENILIAKVKIIPKSCSGDVYYKGFCVSEEIEPSIMNLVVDVYSDNNIIASQSFSNINLNSEQVKIPDFAFNSFSNRNLNIKIRNISFVYNDHDKEVFNKKLLLINDYYASVAIIDSTLNYISTFDIDNPDEVFINSIKRFEVKQIEKKLSAKKFYEKLNLSNFDPEKFISKLYTLHLQTIKLSTLIELLLKSDVNLSCQPDISQLSNYYIGRQLFYIELSRKENHLYTPSFYDLAIYNLTVSDLSDFIRLYDNNNSKLISQLIFRKKLFELANNLFDDYLRTANYFIIDKRYNEAIDILNNACELAQRAEFLQDRNELNLLLTNAKSGIYNSFLKVANKAISIENKKMAQEYLNRAKRFQSENTEFITNVEKFQNANNKLAELYYNEGVLKNNEGNSKSALESFSKASELSGVNMYERFSESLYFNKRDSVKVANINVYQDEQIDIDSEQNRISSETTIAKSNLKAVSKCRLLINESKKLFYEEKFSDALLKLNEAEQLGKNDQDILYQIDSLTERVASSLIMQQVYNAVMFVIDDEFVKAKELYNQSLKFKNEYAFLNRPNVINALHDLSEMIDESKCNSLKKKYEDNLAKGRNEIKQKNFIKAADYLIAAQSIVNKSYDCQLSASEAQFEYNKYSIVIDYQKMMQSIVGDIFEKGLTSVIDKYRKLGKYYTENQISKFGLTHVSFYEFLFSQNNPQLIINTLDYYNETKQYNSSFELLEVLDSRNFSSVMLKTQQKQLGKIMAASDFKSKPESSPLEIIPDKILENKWFTYYCKSYRNEWRRRSIASIFMTKKNDVGNN